jgi:hypothetical protein
LVASPLEDTTMSTDPLRGVDIEIDGTKHTIKFGFKALRLASATFRGRSLEDVTKGLLFDAQSAFDLVACGLSHEKSPRITSDTVEAWCDKDPTLYPRVVASTVAALVEAYRRMNPAAATKAAEAVVEGETQPPPSE